MDTPSPGRLLADRLLQMDEARNARPHAPQQPSEMIKERNARLANQAEKIAALKRAREAAGIKPQLFEGDVMARKRELILIPAPIRGMCAATSWARPSLSPDDVGRSLAADRRKRAKTKVKTGEGATKVTGHGRRRKAASKGREESSQSERRRSEVCPQESRAQEAALRLPISFPSPPAFSSIARQTARTGCMRSSSTAGASRSA